MVGGNEPILRGQPKCHEYIMQILRLKYAAYIQTYNIAKYDLHMIQILSWNLEIEDWEVGLSSYSDFHSPSAIPLQGCILQRSRRPFLVVIENRHDPYNVIYLVVIVESNGMLLSPVHNRTRLWSWVWVVWLKMRYWSSRSVCCSNGFILFNIIVMRLKPAVSLLVVTLG